MKKIYRNFLLLAFTGITYNGMQSQCASTASVGTSSNMFTLIRNGTNPIAVDKDLNTVVYAHRNNATAFGGSSGHIRYDVSTNGGATWTSNIGNLNPTMTSPARYPNAVIYNPAGNTNTNSAYIGYMAATINSVSSAWNGQVTGVRQLSGTGNTENYNQTGSTNVLIPNSMVKGAPGIFWAVDAVMNGTNLSGSFKIYKGTWNGTNDISWATTYTANPTLNTALTGSVHVSDYNIAFDPTGTFGWMSFLSHATGGPSNYAYYPIFYKTTDGGASWTGPIQVDLNQFPCITSLLTGTSVATTAFEHDLTVDINGNPHLLTTICNGDNAYAVYFGYTHHMFDITNLNGVWNAYDIANVNSGRGGWGTSPTNTVTMDMAPQVSRTADGKKIFFTWTDNTTYTVGAANQSPNLFSRAYDVTTWKWTPVKDFTSCNVATNGKMIFPHIAAEVLEPTSTTFKLAGVYGAFSVANDPGQVSNFIFLDNLIYSASDFSVTQTAVSVSIQEGATWLLCPSTSASLSISGAYTQVLWNNGTISNTTSVNTPSTYIATVRNGCTIGADSIVVTGLTASLSPASPSICIGNTETLTVSGNAFSYTWMPVNSTATSIVVSPTTSTVYTITASGDNCTYPQTVSLTVNALPTVSITGNSTVCAGSSVVQTAAGASTYTWNTGANTASVSLSPTVNTTYTVTGTDINSCVNSNTVAIAVNALPSLSVSSSNSMICSGSTATLTGSGASTYTWNTGANIVSISVSPTITTTYTLTGTGTNGCNNSSTFTQSVSTCAGIAQINASSDLLTIYPNPNNGEFIIKCNSAATLQLINELGEVIREMNVSENETEIKVNGLSKGLYFITGKTQNGIIKTKLIIQ